MGDLWPEDIGINIPKSPVAILREQASALGTKTKNIIEGDVRLLNRDSSNNTDNFVYGFIIYAPALNNYRYSLFGISHDIRLYPVSFDLDEDLFQEVQEGQDKHVPPSYHEEHEENNVVIVDNYSFGRTNIVAKTEEEFLHVLTRVLRSKKTLRVVNALLAQSEGVERGPRW